MTTVGITLGIGIILGIGIVGTDLIGVGITGVGITGTVQIGGGVGIIGMVVAGYNPHIIVEIQTTQIHITATINLEEVALRETMA